MWSRCVRDGGSRCLIDVMWLTVCGDSVGDGVGNAIWLTVCRCRYVCDGVADGVGHDVGDAMRLTVRG